MWLAKFKLKQRLILITSVTVVVTAFSVFMLSQKIFGSFIRERFEERMHFLAGHLASGAALGLILRDIDTLQALAASLLKEEAVVAVEITNETGHTILSLGEKETKCLLLEKAVYLASSPESSVFESRKLLGYVRLCYSSKPLDLLLRRLFMETLIVSFFLACFMGALGYFLITRAFVRPLNELLKAAKKVAAGDLEIKVSGRGLPETEELAQAFLQMLSSLNQSREALEKTYQEMLRHRSMAEIGRFSLTIAHEIKNPLGIIKGSLDILRKKEINDKIRLQMINYIEEEVRRLDKLIQNFLSFARPTKIHPRPVDPTELLREIAERVQLEYGPESVLLELPNNKINAIFDPEHLERALLNIIKNAFEAGSNRVYLTVYRKDAELVFEIADDGPGIPSEEKEKIFEPFYSSKAKGTGLGLSLVLQIIEAHGGRVEVDSHQPHGAVFRLMLPCEEGGNGLHSSSG